MNPTKQAKGTTGIHYQIDAELAKAFLDAVPSNDRTNFIERLLARALKRKPPGKRARGQPKKAAE